MDKTLILIVDDEPDIRRAYQKKLEREGFEVATAENGEEGVAMVKERHPALVLMDVKMPVMDGVTAQLKLQEDPETRNTKVVFLTAFSDPNVPEIDMNLAKENGALDFLKKGIELNELVAKIREYLSLPARSR